MSNFDVLGMCLRNLIKRKLRTFLTMLGVIIGTAALVLTTSLGLATDARFARQMEDMEADLTVIQIYAGGRWTQDSDGNWQAPTYIPDLDDQAFETFNRIPGVRVATPLMRGTLYLRSGPYAMDAWNVQGVKPEALALMGYSLSDGRFLEEGDRFAAVFGSSAERNFERLGVDWMNRADRLWRERSGEEVETFVDVFNDEITFSFDYRFTWAGMEDMDIEEAFRPVSSFPLEVVGVMAPTGDTWGVDGSFFMDIETLQYLDQRRQEAERDNQQEWGWFSAIQTGPRLTYDQGFVRVYDFNQTAEVADAIEAMGFSVWYQGQWIRQQQEAMGAIQLLLQAIAAVSVFVAAISIANTMIMAVYERTREIGVMKVIGGAIWDIRRLFLLEAALIGLFGGVLGIGLSFAGSYALNNFDLGMFGELASAGGTGDVVSLITPWLCGVALVFASAIGLISGYFPARRATKLSALAAIRSEA
jgi:ABC-type lipoprotein release transport system permease subunit